MSIRIVTEFTLILLCAISIYTDCRYSLIRNRYLISVGCIAIISNVIGIIRENDADYKSFIMVLCIAVLIDFALYYLKIFAGGDYKLLLCVHLALPYAVCVKTMLNLPLGIVIIGLSCVIGYIWIVVESIYLSVTEKRIAGKKILIQTLKDFVRYLKYFFALVFVNGIVQWLIAEMRLGLHNTWAMYLINIAVVILLAKYRLLNSKPVAGAFVIADIVLGFVNFKMVLDKRTFILWIAIIITGVFRNFVSEFNYKEIDICDLKPGMILSAGSSLQISMIKSAKYSQISDESTRSRLSKENVEYLASFGSKRDDLKRITIVRKVPFAVFIAVSTIVVIVIGEMSL